MNGQDLSVTLGGQEESQRAEQRGRLARFRIEQSLSESSPGQGAGDKRWDYVRNFYGGPKEAGERRKPRCLVVQLEHAKFSSSGLTL